MASPSADDGTAGWLLLLLLRWRLVQLVRPAAVVCCGGDCALAGSCYAVPQIEVQTLGAARSACLSWGAGATAVVWNRVKGHYPNPSEVHAVARAVEQQM